MEGAFPLSPQRRARMEEKGRSVSAGWDTPSDRDKRQQRKVVIGPGKKEQ